MPTSRVVPPVIRQGSDRPLTAQDQGSSKRPGVRTLSLTQVNDRRSTRRQHHSSTGFANDPGWLMMVKLLMIATVLMALTSTARADDPGNAASGRRIAETWCSRCHAVDGTSPAGASSGAPAFATIAANKAATPLAIRVFLQSQHDRMPALHVAPVEIDDLTAYILSLRKH